MASSHTSDPALAALAATAVDSDAATANTDPMEAPAKRSFIQPGVQIKHYELIRKLGEGGMGAVYMARDTRLGRRVAIKFLHDQSGDALPRFLVEARATALCQHENIVVIYDVGDIEGDPYMVLEYIEGKTLRSALYERFESGRYQDKPSVNWAIEMMLPVARALSAAHAMNIVHRDLKPENILLSNTGLVKVVDFGIAKQIGGSITLPKTSEPFELIGNVKLTQAGVMLGTMMYMSPEQWLTDEVDGRTDIWAVGLILFELLTGDHPLAPVSITALTQVVLFDTPMPSAKEKRPDAAALSDVIDRCLRKRKEERYASADELCTALEALLLDRHMPLLSKQACPFAGLSAFQETDARRYFGREQDIAAVLSRLRQQELIVVTGPSGAGKSSFVRAGVIPALKNAEKHLETCVIRPGRKPLVALSDAISFFGDSNGNEEQIDPETFAEMLLEQPGYLGLRLRSRCRRKGPEHRILLFVDQFEELYTMGIDAHVREAFCASLMGMADDASSPLRVILSIRADFLDRLADDRTFVSEVTRGLYFLPAMGNKGLRDALEKPLAEMEYQFDDAALVEEILRGLANMKTPLPILQFLATKLWEARDEQDRRLTTSAYRALGGVAGVLSTHADAMLGAMSPIEQKITRSIFMRLVTPERTRAIVLFDELCILSDDKTAVEQAVQRLAEARLIAIESGDEREGKTVELVHESLIERWGKLRKWLDENEQDAQFLAELRNTAAQWDKNQNAEGFLWRDEAARRAESWMMARKTAGNIELAPRESSYLHAVVHLAQRTRRRWQGAIATLFAVTVVIAVVVSMLAVNARKEARRADDQAERAHEEAKQARNATRLAAARGLQAKDPTKAMVLLREIESGPVPRGWAELILQTWYAGVAETVKVHHAAVLAGRLSPNGRRIALSFPDHTIHVWNTDGTGEPIILRGHEHGAQTIAWSRDGRRVASGARDKTIRIWNPDDSGTPLVLTGHEGDVRSVDWSPDNRMLVAASRGGAVYLWKTDGAPEPVIVGAETGLKGYSAAWSPDGHHLAIGAIDGTVQIWDETGQTRELVLRGHQEKATALEWSPDGSRIASASYDQTVRVWNASGAGEPLILRGHRDIVTGTKWSPDGRYLVSGSQDKTARVWDVRGAGASVVLHGHDDKIVAVDWSADGRQIMSASWDREVRLWNADFLTKRIPLVGHTESVQQVSFSADGRRIVSASTDKTARIWDLDKRSTVRILRGHDGDVNAASFDHEGQRIVTASKDGTVRVWQSEENNEPLVFRGHEGSIWEAIFTPDGRRIVSASDDKTVRIWDSDGQKPPLVLRGHEKRIGAVAISPDGQFIASGSVDQTIRVWPMGGPRELRVFQGHREGVWGLSWSPDGRRIVSGSEDRTLRIWNADGTGAPIMREGHGAMTTVHQSGAFHSDGRLIVSSSNDGSVRIWNADGQGDSIVLHAGDTLVHSATWSPDGKHIAASFQDNTIIVWNDVTIVNDANDVRLWRATNECLPIEGRQRLLGFSDGQAQIDFDRCQQRVAEAARTRK